MPLLQLRGWRTFLFAALMSALAAVAHAVPVVLPSFNVDIGQTSVSGLSSGAFMAVQFSVAYSTIIKGAGLVAGGPYYCAQGDVEIATTKCSCTGIPILSPCEVAPGSTDVGRLVHITNQLAGNGAIDPVSNLARERIWMFSGTIDSVVPPPVMGDLYDYYRRYIPADHIRFRKEVKAEHTMPTEAYGNDCTELGEPFISKCGVDAAGELLNWIYGGNLNPKNAGAPAGELIEFDQAEFVPDHHPERYGLARTGFAYVPAACNAQHRQQCRLHVAFHGCRQNAESVGDAFVRHAGYNPWADSNHIVVLYPQTRATFGRNPKACWDWFNFSGADPSYASKGGHQMRAVKAMIDRVAGLSPAPHFSPQCFTSSNAEHVLNGRAHDRFFLAMANGSDELMGVDTAFTLSTLKETGPNFYEVGTCP